MARRVRRFWSEDEKRRIVAQTWAPGVSVSQLLTSTLKRGYLIIIHGLARSVGDGHADWGGSPPKPARYCASRPYPAWPGGCGADRCHLANRAGAASFSPARVYSRVSQFSVGIG